MTIPIIIQALLLVMAVAIAVQYARGGVKRHIGPTLFHAATAMMVGTAMVAGWDDVRSLILQAVFVVAPHVLTTGYRLGMERAMTSGDFNQALTMARSRALLLPFESHRRDVETVEALVEITHQGTHDIDAAEALVAERLGPAEAEVAGNVLCVQRLSRYARQHDWPGICNFAGKIEAMAPGILRAKALCLLARAHAESRDVQSALDALKRLEEEPTWHRVRVHLRPALMAVLAVGGRQRAVQLLLDQHFAHLDGATRLAWRIRAAVAAGDRERAEADLETLFTTGKIEAAVHEMLVAQVARMPDAAPEQAPGVGAALERLESMAFLEATLAGPLGRWMLAVPASLLVVVLAAFAGTHGILGGETGVTLFAVFGALWGTEPWRFVTGTLLQETGWDLILHGAAVVLLGSAVGSLFGRLRLWVIYLAAGVVAGIVSGLVTPDKLLVTSSAAVLGLGGAVLASSIRCRACLPKYWMAVPLKRVAVLAILLLLENRLAAHGSLSAGAVGLAAGVALGATLALERFDLLVPARARKRSIGDVSGGRGTG